MTTTLTKAEKAKIKEMEEFDKYIIELEEDIAIKEKDVKSILDNTKVPLEKRHKYANIVKSILFDLKHDLKVTIAWRANCAKELKYRAENYL